ncbi:MAG: GntP family permease [Kiritimatiellae bacterium]|nr:GntP family permease [Kiritimatiellia bacterium]
MVWRLWLAPAIGVALLLVLILRWRVQAFLALIIASVAVGFVAGMPPAALLTSMQNGMGNTLGFVATVVGLGAMLGQVLESSGGAHALAMALVRRWGTARAPLALMLAGFCIAIPVFFDVGFIILVPVLTALAGATGRSILQYAIPLLAGLAVTHSFVPPTPGPVAVAEILKADLGWVIALGIVTGLPTALVAGPLFGGWIAKRVVVAPPPTAVNPTALEGARDGEPPWTTVAGILAMPLVLIVANTAGQLLVKRGVWSPGWLPATVSFVGHPFVALLVATLTAVYVLGVRRGRTGAEMMELCVRSLAPAGVIILITGAGGMLKQVLVDSGVGSELARLFGRLALPPIVLGWLLAAAVRIAQGSSTVAMITAAGILAPMVEQSAMSPPHRALTVLAIAAGATILSHVNDSGFWLVGRYCGLTERQTLQSWTVMETIIAVAGLAMVLLASLIV